jgi:uncharacterized protein (DUF697 family)
MWGYVAVGAFVALFPLASFVLIALEVVMVFNVAKKYGHANLGDLIWFCSAMVTLSLFLKFLAAWLHLIPIIGQVANSAVAATFIYFAYSVADEHYRKL